MSVARQITNLTDHTQGSNTMKTTFAAALVAGLVLVSCGSDSDGSEQDKVADLIIQAAQDAGVEPDESCIRDAAKKLSDEDADAMVDAGIEGEPDISEAANDVLVEILTC
jgi:hypothetical protein